MVMAQIYARCGGYEEATDEIEYVLSLETEMTIHRLKFLTWAAPLFEDPYFQAMISRYRA